MELAFLLLLKELSFLLLGELFAQAPVEQYPGIAVETVTDSSRYFVIRIQDGTGKGAGVFSGVRSGNHECMLIKLCPVTALVLWYLVFPHQSYCGYQRKD